MVSVMCSIEFITILENTLKSVFLQIGVWLPEVKRWVLAYRPKDLVMCNTNNGTERLNEELKYEDLDRNVHSTLSELLTVIIKDFIPRRYESYIEKNVRYTSGFKKYEENIPSHLHNRPRWLVVDILNKQQLVTESSIHSVKFVDENQFSVEGDQISSTEKAIYLVDFGDDDNFVSCTCYWYKRNRTLCKHFFAVIQAGHKEFTDLSQLYLNHPLHTLDPNIFSSDVPMQDLVLLNAPDSNHSESVATAFSSQIHPNASTLDPENEEVIHFDELQKRVKPSKFKKMTLLANLKHLTELCYNVNYNNINFIELLDEKTKEMIDLVSTHLKKDDDDLIERSESPKRRYKLVQPEIQQEPLPKRAKKHPYAGRVGVAADMMKQWYRANIPINSLNKSSPVKKPVVRIISNKVPLADKEIEVSTTEPTDGDIVVTKTVAPKYGPSRRYLIEPVLSTAIEKQILDGNMLEDDAINLAQSILARQFTVRGLQDTSLEPLRFCTHFNERFVQILYCSPSHWISIYGRKKGILVFDSLQRQKLPKSVVRTIATIRSTEDAILEIRKVSVQQQENGIDCGAFSIAFLVEILFGNDLRNCSFLPGAMREHLLTCLQLKEFSVFPKTTNRVPKSKFNLEKHHVFCVCRDVFFDEDVNNNNGNFMAQCSKCNEWFHRKCVTIPNSVFTDEKEHSKWVCGPCSK